ncbi:MAG: hypothetical protein KDA37_13590, partial [Planctomycetales bacterium]|nr:hypothetical protein [Planctomycetales bacterium]
MVQNYHDLAGGNYTIVVGGDGASGDYTLTAILNADVELPAANDSPQHAQSLEDAFQTQGSGAQRGAVLGGLDMPSSVLFSDDFSSGSFLPSLWSLVENATIDGVGLNEPSEPFSARLNGYPTGGDRLETVAIDLSGAVDPVLAYSFEQGGGGEQP